MITKTKLLVVCGSLALGAGVALAGDETGKKYGDETQKKKWDKYAKVATDPAKLVGLFDRALESCCAEQTCAEEGGCMAPCAGCASGACDEDHAHPVVQLASALASSPAALDAVAQSMKERFLADDASAERRALIAGLLGWSESEAAPGLAEALYGVSPKSFGTDEMIAFAKGSKLFRGALSERAKRGETRPLAFFALDEYSADDAGRKRARKALARTAAKGAVDVENVADTLLASHVVAKLGDGQALADTLERVHAAALAALDEGDLDTARALAVRTEFFTRFGKAQGLGHLGTEMEMYCVERTREVASADAVFELIERIPPG